ncbi:MAG: DUF3179 domain-containing (seleno)protein [Myxococcota bacterium]|nr:DUF3179 domain-containing (seleno)protein [Myxococcota bacterium]
MTRPRALGLALAAALLLGADPGDEPEASDRPNGFALSHLEVPRDSILAGGPPRDGIRSVDEPGFVAVADASWVRPDTVVIGVELAGEARAYPVHVLEWHQVVNDSVGGVPVVVTYDPLTGAPKAFRRNLGDRVLAFGVSGLIHNSNFLLFDRETDSLWLQWDGRALAGALAGKRLEPVALRQEVLGVWQARRRDTRVLERPEPRRIDYRYSRFKAYWVSDEIPFPVAAKDTRFHAKELVLGVVVGGRARAYLGSLLTKAGGRIVDEFQGRRIQVDYDTNLGAFAWDVAEGVDVGEAYWFAWKAFHPDTDVWRPDE